jgi:hypothetical protein
MSVPVIFDRCGPALTFAPARRAIPILLPTYRM